jgi:hypothetical protein
MGKNRDIMVAAVAIPPVSRVLKTRRRKTRESPSKSDTVR